MGQVEITDLKATMVCSELENVGLFIHEHGWVPEFCIILKGKGPSRSGRGLHLCALNKQFIQPIAEVSVNP